MMNSKDKELKEFRKQLCGTRSDLTNKELFCIFKYLEKFEYPKYLEIGVYFGGTFLNTIRYITPRKANFKAIGVDLFEDLVGEDSSNQTHDIKNKWNILNVAYVDELKEKILSEGFENFSLLKGQSHIVIKEVREKIDVCFIDGNHTYEQTKKDTQASLSILERGSFMIFHNSTNHKQPDKQYAAIDGGPWKVCEELKNNKRVKFIETIDRSAVFEVVK